MPLQKQSAVTTSTEGGVDEQTGRFRQRLSSCHNGIRQHRHVAELRRDRQATTRGGLLKIDSSIDPWLP